MTQPKYVFHPQLGHNGRLGNQLWQLAGTLGHAQRENLAPAIRADWEYRDCFTLSGVHRRMGIEEQSRVIGGYQQEYDVLRRCPGRVRKALEFTESVKERAFRYYPHIDPNKSDMAIHVRRGDYMNLQDLFYTLTEVYYERAYKRAVDELSEIDKVYLFSDDLKAAEELLPFPVIPVRPRIEGCSDPQLIELYLMSRCGHHITANSTFSWWGAWLSGNHGAYYPDYWAYPKLELHDRWRRSMPPTWKEVEARP